MISQRKNNQIIPVILINAVLTVLCLFKKVQIIHHCLLDILMKRNKILARFIALHGIRNSSELEELHAGEFPVSATGDYSDVKVMGPFGEIEWNKVSRISDKEMRNLMLDIEEKIYPVLEQLLKLEKQADSKTHFEETLEKLLFDEEPPSWDLLEEDLIQKYGKDYKSKLKI